MASDDFVVTIHALLRFEERIQRGLSDQEMAAVIHDDVMDALCDGRHGYVPPLELANNALERTVKFGTDSFYAWTRDKSRGYVLRDDPDGLHVMTVLRGVTHAQALRKLFRGRGGRYRRPPQLEVKGEEA